MCTPAIGMLLNFVGAMAQAKGQRDAAQARADQYRYQAQVDENNRKVELWKAEDAIARGKKEEAIHRTKVSQLKGRQRSVLAASGVVVDEGSALDILEDTAMLGELDALTIRSNAEREEYEHKVRASNIDANKQMNLLAASNAIRAGKTASMTSLLQGAGSMATKWYDYST